MEVLEVVEAASQRDNLPNLRILHNNYGPVLDFVRLMKQGGYDAWIESNPWGLWGTGIPGHAVVHLTGWVGRGPGRGRFVDTFAVVSIPPAGGVPIHLFSTGGSWADSRWCCRYVRV